MSGGSLDYSYEKINDIVDKLNHFIGLEKNKERRELIEKFQQHLVKISNILQGLEWVWSGDCGEKKYKIVLEQLEMIR